MLFILSSSPRIDREECRLLDSANCRAMFCHSDWYRELIARQRGAANRSPIVQWPYPIDPWPEGPLPDEYDLLIYDKNGHHPLLMEHLARAFPRHVILRYGSYRREELYSATRRARACAYLADDDHGPRALQEILLAGCPTVGVRTGAPFVRTGVTGELVQRLPPGDDACSADTDRYDLSCLIQAVERVREMDRTTVREIAVAEFSVDAVTAKVLEALDAARQSVLAGASRQGSC
jgi:hypothetical protein